MRITSGFGHMKETSREDFYATIGLCYEDEEVELFRYVHRDLIFPGSREKLYKHGNSRKN